jgi:hypothetical protein
VRRGQQPRHTEQHSALRGPWALSSAGGRPAARLVWESRRASRSAPDAPRLPTRPAGIKGASSLVGTLPPIAKRQGLPGDTIHTLYTSNGSPYQNFQGRIM